ncbi:MAG: ImmA/IrrE family metallo-endopeptidase [Proteobacteria bacterium]|nr:ImmA/IrrE family metallo-endopeptidase [Pseudomonadota bacterium]
MIGVRLKLARTATGFSLRGLAAAISHCVSAQSIGKYERNEAMPSSSTLIALANALHTTVEYLLGDPDLVLDDLEFRKNGFISKREEAQVEATVLVYLERYLAVEDILQLQSIRWDVPRDVPYPVFHSSIEADRAADALRYYWGLGHEPIPNLVELLEERGIKIFAFPLGGLGGLAARARRPRLPPVPIVVVNAEDWGERQRFTLAHELGHIVLDISPDLDAERVAHRFAGAMLMPAKSLWLEVGKHRSSIPLGELLALKHVFGVSIQALTYRCRELDIINQTTYRALFNEFERLGWRTHPFKEYGAMDGERPNRFNRLCLRALAEGAISEAKAAEILDVGMTEVSNYMRGTLSSSLEVE